jgi:phage terminase large subunit-like protein
MTSPGDVLTGSQEPRVRSCPVYEFSSGPDAVAIYERTGRRLDEWQRSSLDDHCAERADGKWFTLESAEEVPRQNGKGEIINALMLLHLFVLRTEVVIYSAHEFKTAKEAYLKIYALVKNTPEFDKQVAYYHNSNEDTSIGLRSGQRLRFLTRSKDGGRGFTGDVIIFDEAFNLNQASMAAILPTLSSRPNPHIYYFSSSGKDTGESDVFRGLKARGDEGDPSLIWLSYSADPKTADPDSAESRAQANPAYNIRIFDSFIDVERKTFTEIDFMRERLGVWDDTKTAAVIDLDVWAAAGDVLSSALDPVSFAIDIPPDSSFTSVAIAGRRADGKVHTEVVKRSRGTGWVVDFMEDMQSKWKPASIVLDAIGPAGALLNSFAIAGVDVEVVSMREYGQACGSFKEMVLNDDIRHKDQPGLNAALESARKRPLGDSGAWGWNRRDETDISPLVAVTLAVFAHSRSAAAAQPPVDSRMFVFGR